MSGTGLQQAIEQAMQQFGENRRWTGLTLLSSEGLKLASQGSGAADHESLTELSFTLKQSVELMEEEIINEINVIMSGSKRLVFRFFHAWDEPLILIGTVNGRWGYKRAMDRLIKHIQNIA